MSEQEEVVAVTRSITGLGAAALTSIANNLAHVTINIPSGKGGILYAVSISWRGTDPTTILLGPGGCCTFHNSASDWNPFYVPTGTWTCVTDGAHALKPFVFEMWKKLPGNSTVTVDYIPYDNQSQTLEITLHWIMTEADPEYESFSDVVHPLEADSISSVTRSQIVTSWAHNAADAIPIPGHKGGTLQAAILQIWPVIETVVVSGHEVEFFCDAHDITPMEFYTHMVTLVTAGAAAWNPMVIPHSHEVKANSNYTAWQTARDNQEQTVTFGIVWQRPYGTKR